METLKCKLKKKDIEKVQIWSTLGVLLLPPEKGKSRKKIEYAIQLETF